MQKQPGIETQNIKLILLFKITIKFPKNSECEAHLDRMIKIHEKIRKLGLEVSHIEKQGNNYEIEYIDGDNLTEYIRNFVEKRDKEKIINEMDKYYSLLKSISYYKKATNFNNAKIKTHFENKNEYYLKEKIIDLHLSNIIVKNGKYYVIDQEWESKYDVPMNYMMLISINLLFESVPQIKGLFKIDFFLNKYKIKEEEILRYYAMSNDFYKKELQVVNKKIMNIMMTKNYYSIDESINQNLLLISELKRNNKQLELNFEEKLSIIKSLKSDIDKYENSISWKVTKPIRLFKKHIKKIIQLFRFK